MNKEYNEGLEDAALVIDLERQRLINIGKKWSLGRVTEFERYAASIRALKRIEDD